MLGIVVLVAMGPWSPRSHSRVVGTFNDLVVPVGWEFVSEHRSGNVACLDQCPTVTRIYWINGSLDDATRAIAALLETDGFDVTVGPVEDPVSAPPRRYLRGVKGPVKFDVTVVQGSTVTDVDHPPATVPGRSGAVMSLRVETFRDGVYAP